MPGFTPAIGAPKSIDEVDPKDLVMTGEDVSTLIATVEDTLKNGVPLDMPWGIPGRPLCLALRSLRDKTAEVEKLEKRVEELEGQLKDQTPLPNLSGLLGE